MRSVEWRIEAGKPTAGQNVAREVQVPRIQSIRAIYLLRMVVQQQLLLALGLDVMRQVELIGGEVSGGRPALLVGGGHVITGLCGKGTIIEGGKRGGVLEIAILTGCKVSIRTSIAVRLGEGV